MYRWDYKINHDRPYLLNIDYGLYYYDYCMTRHLYIYVLICSEYKGKENYKKSQFKSNIQLEITKS